MTRTVQLLIADAGYADALREALARSGPWHVESADRANPAPPCVQVVDEAAFAALALPLANPERIVLISRQDPGVLSQAWDAGIVSVVSDEDPLGTVLLAIMAAALRVPQIPSRAVSSGISPNATAYGARITPENQSSRSRRCKTR